MSRWWTEAKPHVDPLNEEEARTGNAARSPSPAGGRSEGVWIQSSPQHQELTLRGCEEIERFGCRRSRVMRTDVAMVDRSPTKRAVHSTKKRPEQVTQLVRPLPPGEGRGEGSRVMRTDVAMVDRSPTKRAVHSTKKR